jgi:hypothetical protein
MASVPAPFQQRLAMYVVVTGSIVAGVCAIAAIVAASLQSPEEAGDTAKEILAILLPVLGTWIGTVLAFYFGRENFEAGARETRLSLGQQRLDSLAIDAAIKPADIKPLSVPDAAAAGALPLSQIDTHLKTIKFARTPVLTTDQKPLYVVHRQPLDSFLVSKAQAGSPTAGLTLQDLLADPQGQIVKDSFVIVPQTATLAEAKAAMEGRKGCQDVFITQTGKADSPIVAWLTNNEIQRAASG